MIRKPLVDWTRLFGRCILQLSLWIRSDVPRVIYINFTTYMVLGCAGISNEQNLIFFVGVLVKYVGTWNISPQEVMVYIWEEHLIQLVNWLLIDMQSRSAQFPGSIFYLNLLCFIRWVISVKLKKNYTW